MAVVVAEEVVAAGFPLSASALVLAVEVVEVRAAAAREMIALTART